VSALKPEFITEDRASQGTSRDDRAFSCPGFRTFWAHVVILGSTHRQQFVPRRTARQASARYTLITLEARETYHSILKPASGNASFRIGPTTFVQLCRSKRLTSA
jgi:hypothetical protein